MRIIHYCAAALVVLAAIACQKTADEKTENTSTHANAMRNVRTEVVSVQSFRKTIATTGTVAFNQNKSTQVLSPISGPVAQMSGGRPVAGRAP